MKEAFSTWVQLIGKLYALIRPYGRKAPLMLLAVILLQGIMQVVGVTSIFPFLAVASDPEAFRQSGLGKSLLARLPEMTNLQLLVWAGIGSISILVLSNAVNLLGEHARSRYAQRLGHSIRMDLLARLASKPWSYFLTANTAVLLKKLNFDVNHMALCVVVPVLEALSRAVSALLLIGTLIAINWKIALGAAVAFGVYYLLVYSFLRARMHAASERLKWANRGVISESQQLLTGIKIIKVHAAEDVFLRRFERHSSEQSRTNTFVPLYMSAPKYILEPLAFGGIILVVILYAAGGSDLGAIIPTLGMIGLAGFRLLPAMQLLYGQIAQVDSARYSLDEVLEEFADTQGESAVAPAAGGKAVADLPFEREISVRNLGFSYETSRQPVLSGLSFTLTKNSSLAIVGKTGSGKSTLIDLLMGLQSPTEGTISIDGKVLDAGLIPAWQRGIGYVPQDVFLIDDTVARNIALGVEDGEIDQKLLHEVAAAAHVLDFVTQLPQGFATEVGERGVRLSGGQKQRIALARALYRRPQVLILDEATSALDVETEAAVVEAINSLSGKITMVVVAHRLSTVERCEQRIELDQSRPS